MGYSHNIYTHPQHCREQGRVVTGGADNTVRVWELKEQDGALVPVFLSNLDRHTKTVNSVRFSPDGSVLASASDDGLIMFWKLDGSGEISSSEPKAFGEDSQQVCNSIHADKHSVKFISNYSNIYVIVLVVYVHVHQ